MHDIGIKISVDTGDAVSSLERFKGAITDTGKAMKKAQKEGRLADAEELSSTREKLRVKKSGFERDIKTLYNDPRFLTQDADGKTVFKMDSEYANIFKGHTEAIKKLADEYQGSIRSGNMERVRELTPQLERQQYDFHKTLRSILNTNGKLFIGLNPDATIDWKVFIPLFIFCLAFLVGGILLLLFTTWPL